MLPRLVASTPQRDDPTVDLQLPHNGGRFRLRSVSRGGGMPHPHEGGQPPASPVLVRAEDLHSRGGSVVVTPEDQLVFLIHLPRVRQRHLPATDAAAREPLLLDPPQHQFAEIPTPDPAEDLVSGNLPLNPHDPVPSGDEPLHLAQQFDCCFEVVGGVPSSLKLPR